jgi:ATP-dependent DNA helicase RecG
MPDLADPVQFLKGVGPHRAEDFARLEVHTVGDLLFTFPRCISDRSRFVPLSEVRLHIGEEVSLRARAIEAQTRRVRGGRQMTTVTFDDGTACIEGIWFNSTWIHDRYEGEDVFIFGKVDERGGRVQLVHPRLEAVGRGESVEADQTVGRMVPVYPLTGRLTQTVWRRVMQRALDEHLALVPEILPGGLRAERSLMPRADAIRNMHFPESAEGGAAARERLAYDECLLLQLGLAYRRQGEEASAPGRSMPVSVRVRERIARLFPFSLTKAQQRAAEEILADMASPQPMNRLLQGDVGCGKTAVAVYAGLVAVANGAQVAIMAPTELLARQHEMVLQEFLQRSDRNRVQVGLLVGGLKEAERNALLAGLVAGAVDIVVGTHAAIQEDVAFRDLGLVIIDEQHRFGVWQRTRLRQKGVRPDVLVMTATPIPRSLALTLYGDLDVSVIDDLPPGRRPVRTSVPEPAAAERVYDWLRAELTRGRQAYVVCPLVSETESSKLQSAEAEYERLRNGPFASFRVGLLHGRMNRAAQIEVMAAFREGRIDVLVSTVVIEVGVDVPNATLMVILHAERFGMAQLHQLRGRVARGREQGHCVLLSEATSGPGLERLEILAREHDGFRIAEEDLRLRGEGEFLGTRQHGHALTLASLTEDFELLKSAREDARTILANDPGLQTSENEPLREALFRVHGDRLDLARTG